MVCDTNGSGVVALDEGTWLRPSNLDQRLAKGDHFLGADVESATFGFSRRWHDTFDDLSDGEDRSIVARDWYVF